MFRKLSLALAVSAALSSPGALALGLGEISTRSALNENFNADIELISVGDGELDGISVTLATPSDFARRGLERPFLLSKLRFDKVELDDGRPVIRVTTGEAVREPFLNFLVEVNWPKGRLVREFTVLLDPPVTVDRESARILPVVSAPVHVAASPQPVAEPYRREERYVPVRAAPEPRATMAGEYGPVPRGATLWRIAREMEVPGASTEQMVMALFRSNPGAFGGNNINNLQAGATLQIPGQEAIFGQSQQQARAEFRTQARSRAGSSSAPAAPAGLLQITAPPAEEAADTDIEQVKSDLMLVRETGESTRQETEELRSRIRELEAQLADIRQLLKLKSDQLAALQAGQTAPEAPAEEMGEPLVEVEAEPPEEAEPVAKVEVESPEEVIEEVASPQPEEEATAQVPAELEEPEQVAEEPPEPVEEAPAEPEPVVAEAPVAPQAEPEPQPVQLPKVDAPPPPKALPAKPAPEPGLLDQLLSNTTLLGTAAAVAVVLLSLVWLLLRRRRESKDQFDESVLLAPNDSTTVELERESEVADSLEHDEETSFISDFSPSDIDALQEETGEVDPAAEADVYLAYGRYQQAESLINQAVEKAPNRLDLKLKLLEIYFTTRNISSFTSLAEQLDSDGAPDKDPQLWSRAQSMGRELVPGHELFGSAEAGEEEIEPESVMGGGEEDTVAADSEALDGLDLDLDTELSELQGESTPAPAGFGEGAVLEPPTLSGRAAGQGAESVDEGFVDEDSEFAIDLSDLDTLEDLDLGDLGMDSEEVGTGQQPQSAATEPEAAMKPTEEESVPAVDAESESSQDESEFEVSQFDLGGPEASDTEVSEPVLDVLDEDGDTEEDTGTKLDLARAYLEMGDTEGASEFLGEVLEEGDEAQKAAAKELMAKIA